mmetsp:Transcript_12627/g.16962  ORF Transcript_12627/g.16962 Transcript_12627/m.16962 type:complete len:240 (+) Transcript_12627:85-804(+)
MLTQYVEEFLFRLSGTEGNCFLSTASFFPEISHVKKFAQTNWRTFEHFLNSSSPPLVFDPKTATDKEINSLLKKFAFNVRKENGDDYKDMSLKNIWNNIAKQIEEKIFASQQREIDIFEGLPFLEARNARGAKRSVLQKDPTKRVVHATPVSSNEAKAMLVLGEQTPLRVSIAHYFTWEPLRGGDAFFWFLTDFTWETSNKGGKSRKGKRREKEKEKENEKERERKKMKEKERNMKKRK